ncbi:MAG: ribosome assembly RNA-binding protein YhbY [Proteobacteria bacterium]|nr:ribosome assembly RNA-binding protein YhbY [Pseudomonadota bacterium]MBU1640766.1 ribosome assembly RNA-binding protein YhbY [Pseudomonadota bacterium]
MAKKTKKKAPILAKKQLRFLRGLAHNLDPLVMIGQNGLTPQVIKSVDDVFRTHELIKVKVQSTADVDRPETAATLAAECGAALVQIIGRIIILYRPNTDMPPDQTIHIPKG